MSVAVLSTLVSLVISPSLIVLAFLQSQWVATTTLFGKISSIDFAKKPSVEVSEKREREREGGKGKDCGDSRVIPSW